MKARDRAIKGGPLRRSDVADLVRATGLDKDDLYDLVAILEGDAPANGIRVYPGFVLNRGSLSEMRYGFFRGRQEIYKWSSFNLLGRDDVYAIQFQKLDWKTQVQLLRVLLMRQKISSLISYSLFPAAPIGWPRPKPSIDVAFQNNEFAETTPVTTLGEPIKPKPLLGGIETADDLGSDLISDSDLAVLLSISRHEVLMRYIRSELPPAHAIEANLFWVKSLFFEAQPEPAKDESADRIIDLNEISVLVGGDREVYRLTRDRGALPVGKEIDGRTYWRESDILRWIGRVRREVPKRTYGEEDYWDFDDLARYLNRSRDQIFELVAKGDFPAGVQVGDQLCWSKADVRQWFAGLQLDTLDSLKKSRWKEAIMEIRRVYKAPRGTT